MCRETWLEWKLRLSVSEGSRGAWILISSVISVFCLGGRELLLVVSYWRFGRTYWCRLQGSGSPRRPFKMEPKDYPEMPVNNNNNNNNNNVILSSVLAVLEATHRLTSVFTVTACRHLIWHIFIYLGLLTAKRRSQGPRGLRRGSAAARVLRIWVRIPPGSWMFVCCECCVLSRTGLCDELISRPEEYYRLWCVVVWSRNLVNEETLAHWEGGGRCRSKNSQTNKNPLINAAWRPRTLKISTNFKLPVPKLELSGLWQISFIKVEVSLKVLNYPYSV